jgi:beta-lactam-binding protein with PASTA domain
VGVPGLIIGLRDAQSDAEGAAAAAATGAGTVSTTTGPPATEFVVPNVSGVSFDAAVRTLAADQGQFQAREILVTDSKAKEPPVVVTQDPAAGGSLPRGGVVTLRVHVKPPPDAVFSGAEVASTLRKIADELTAGKS